MARLTGAEICFGLRGDRNRKVQYCNLHGGMSETDDDDLIIGGWAVITVLLCTFYKFACKYNNAGDDDLIIGGWAGQSTISI